MKFFISHSSKDNSIVRKILIILNKYQIPYWVDQKALDGEGQSVWNEINNGLESSDHFLLVFSAHAKYSKNVKKEVMIIINPDSLYLLYQIQFFSI